MTSVDKSSELLPLPVRIPSPSYPPVICRNLANMREGTKIEANTGRVVNVPLGTHLDLLPGTPLLFGNARVAANKDFNGIGLDRAGPDLDPEHFLIIYEPTLGKPNRFIVATLGNKPVVIFYAAGQPQGVVIDSQASYKFEVDSLEKCVFLLPSKKGAGIELRLGRRPQYPGVTLTVTETRGAGKFYEKAISAHHDDPSFRHVRAETAQFEPEFPRNVKEAAARLKYGHGLASPYAEALRGAGVNLELPLINWPDYLDPRNPACLGPRGLVKNLRRALVKKYGWQKQEVSSPKEDVQVSLGILERLRALVEPIVSSPEDTGIFGASFITSGFLPCHENDIDEALKQYQSEKPMEVAALQGIARLVTATAIHGVGVGTKNIALAVDRIEALGPLVDDAKKAAAQNSEHAVMISVLLEKGYLEEAAEFFAAALDLQKKGK